MKQIEKLISPLIQSHFPEFYKDEGPRFVDFITEYYAWMETTNQAIAASRNLFSTRDIDTTSDDFVKYYKQKYSSGFPIGSKADSRMLIKHAQDFYKSKGTAESIELVIRSMYDQPASVYLPSTDLFKTSDGTWVRPVYLELSVSDRTKSFVGKEIVGNESGAKAFLENLVRRRIGTKYVEVAYLSNVRGDFSTGEHITTSANTVLVDAPKVAGSMTELTVQSGGANFQVGDVFSVVSSNGKQGKARVTEISNETGKVNFIYVDALTSGGWGYSLAHANVIISSKVLTLANVNNANTLITGFERFEGVVQPFINIAYSSAKGNNQYFDTGNIVENYDGTGSVNANGTIVQSVKSTATTGYIIVAPNVGNLATTDTTFSVRSISPTSITFNASVVNDVNYSYTQAFTGAFTGAYTKAFTTPTAYTGVSAYTGTYTGAYTGTFTGEYSGAYVRGWSGAYTGVFSTYTGIFSGTYTAAYTGAYTGAYSQVFTGPSLLSFSKAFSGAYSTAYTGAFTGVYAGTSGIITTIGAHGFSNNDLVRYEVFTGNTVVSPLSSGTAYYVVNAASTTLQLANTPGGAAISLTKGFNQVGHQLTKTYGTAVITSYLDRTATGNVVGSNVAVDYTGFLGVTDQSSNGFIVTPYSKVVGLRSNTTATVANVSTGTGAGFNISLLTDTESVFLSPDFLHSNNTQNVVFHTINLNGNNSGAALQFGSPRALSTGDTAYGGFGFVKFPGSHMDSILLDCLRFDATVIGSIAAISGINPGTDYNVDPFVVVHDPYVAGYGKHDYVMQINTPTGAFIYGEQIQQAYDLPAIQLTVNTFSGTAANGTPTSTVVVNEFVYQSNATTNVVASGYVVEAGISAGSGTIKIANVTGTFVNTTSVATKLKTLTSGATANIQSTQVTTVATVARALIKEVTDANNLKLKRINLENTFQYGSTIIGRSSGAVATVISVEQDLDTIPVGLNANIVANVQTANNVVTKLAVADSGFGYVDQETVTLTKEDSVYEVTALVQLGKQGVGNGYFSTTKGFLDSDKKLHDNDYYQEYSYEVQTKIPFDTYFGVLKQLAHIAGTKAFGKVSSESSLDLNMTAINSIDIT